MTKEIRDLLEGRVKEIKISMVASDFYNMMSRQVECLNMDDIEYTGNWSGGHSCCFEHDGRSYYITGEAYYGTIYICRHCE